MRRLLAAVLAATLVAFGPVPMTAWAQDGDVTRQVEELSAEAAGAYKEGNYEKAIELFQQAYDLQAVPNLLFNIAKVYEKMEDWENAIANYREFIKAPDADSGAREVALDRIDSLEDIRRAEREAEERRLAEQRKKEEEARKAEQAKAEEREPTEEDSGGGNTAAWITLSSGAALLAGGVVFGLLASNEQSKFDAGATAEDRRAARDSGTLYAIVADSMFAGGALATTVGIILFAVSGSGDSDPEAQAVLPSGFIGPNGEAGLAFEWRF